MPDEHIKETDLVLQQRNNTSPKNKGHEVPIIAHRYAIHFDIHPNITYLNQDIVVIIADILQLIHQFPDDAWISQQSVEEGLDFCRVNFWVFSDSSDALKQFSIWFQALFREKQVSEVLERLVLMALDESDNIEVDLTDWTRLNVLETDIKKAIQNENDKK